MTGGTGGETTGAILDWTGSPTGITEEHWEEEEPEDTPEEPEAPENPGHEKNPCWRRTKLTKHLRLPESVSWITSQRPQQFVTS